MGGSKMDHPATFIFEPAAPVREAISVSLLGCGFDVVPVADKALLLRLLDSRAANAVLLGPSTISRTKPFDLAYKIREFAGAVPLIAIVDNSSEELVIAAIQARIDGYVKYPLTRDEL